VPHILLDNGQAVYVPGVYYSTIVASSLPGPLPQFHVPILLGHGTNGHPYNADGSLVANENPHTPFRLVNVESVASSYFGENSDIHAAVKFAKRHGLPFCYVANLSAMTRASLIANATGPLEQFTLYARQWGPSQGWTKIKQATGIYTITPVKRYAMLSANLGSSATRMTFARPVDWLTVGASVVVGANNVAGVSRTISAIGSEIQANGQRLYWAELSSSVGSACNTSSYAMVLQYDTDHTVISPTFTTSQGVIDWFNATPAAGFIAVKHANFSNALPIAISSSTPLKEVSAWGTATAGTSPAVTGSDVDAFIALMNGGELDAFLLREQVIPQTYLLVDGSSTNHGKMRDYATAERSRPLGFPISVTVGCRWGDTVIGAGDDTDPTTRAASLNSQDVQLAAGGLDREAAYVSLAAAIWALRIAGGVGHNQTNDTLVFSELEKKWNEVTNGDLTALSKKGVVSYKLSPGDSGFAYKVSQGLSTLQANDGLIWNTTDATTWSTMQRDVVDFVTMVIREGYEGKVIGADRVDPNAVATVLIQKASKLCDRGYLKPLAKGGFQITTIELNDAANGFDVDWSIKTPDTVDFIKVRTTILVGAA
jgi:hypothetical protein